MNLKKCDNGHFYDADRYEKCPHCINRINNSNDESNQNITGGIIMHQCAWCGAGHAMHYSVKICPSCHNNLDGSHNDYINTVLAHFEQGNQYYKNREFDKAEKEFLEFLKIEDSYKESKEYNMLIRSRMIYEQELIELLNEDKCIFNVSIDIDYVYYALGTIEVEKKNILKARDYLRKAIEWNPVYIAAFFEYAETFKIEGNIETFYTITKNTYDKIFLPGDLARYYRNLGFYFIEKENYNLATYLFLHSLSFEDTDMAKSEIMYIKQKTGSLNIPEPDVTKHILEENNIPTFISNRCYALLDKYGLLNTAQEHYCPQCGQVVDIDALFCSKCGMELRENKNDTLAFCPICEKGTYFEDTYCRQCGSKINLINTKETITDENDIKNAQTIIEKLIRLYNINSNDEYHLSMLLNLIKYVPLYIPVNIDVDAMLGGKNPQDLKIGDDIILQQDVEAKIATIKTDDFECVPLFTKGEYVNSSVMRFYPIDYLPIIVKMNISAVINIFNNYKFVLPEKYLNDMLVSVKQNDKEKNIRQNELSNCKSYCPSCGAEFDNNEKFCIYCGSKIEIKTVSNEVENDNVEILINDRYALLKKIHSYNNISVYIAMDTRINKSLAVKIFDKSKINDDENSAFQLNAFISQAEFLKKLDHPSIIRIYDIGENDDIAYIVMNYIEGETLQKILDEYGPQPENRVAEWAKQVADVLVYLSKQNPPIIHRDIKPHNIRLKPDGNIVLMDFTIAREYVPGLLKDEMRLGTKGFAAPEQFGSAQTDCRTDIYGLGVTLYYLLTGNFPERIRDSGPLNEVLISNGISAYMEYIVDKCTQLDPKDRFQTPEELMSALNGERINKQTKKDFFSKLFK